VMTWCNQSYGNQLSQGFPFSQIPSLTCSLSIHGQHSLMSCHSASTQRQSSLAQCRGETRIHTSSPPQLRYFRFSFISCFRSL